MSSGYSALPPVYDRWQRSYGEDFTTLILPRVLSTLHTFHVPVSTMLDLCCGTGSLCLEMAKRGWEVTGIDGSAGMISVARTKIVQRRRPPAVTLFVQDMRRLRLQGPVGLVTCLFDSVNHLLTRRDLMMTFKGIHRVLVPGGYLLFDTNNERCFRTLWTQTEVLDRKDFTLVLKNSYDARRHLASSRVTLFQRQGEVHRRTSEIVRERCHPHGEIRRLLERAGFGIRVCEDFNFTPMDEMAKIKTWWVAQRPARD